RGFRSPTSSSPPPVPWRSSSVWSTDGGSRDGARSMAGLPSGVYQALSTRAGGEVVGSDQYSTERESEGTAAEQGGGGPLPARQVGLDPRVRSCSRRASSNRLRRPPGCDAFAFVGVFLCAPLSGGQRSPEACGIPRTMPVPELVPGPMTAPV